jgi:hypothetical protein
MLTTVEPVFRPPPRLCLKWCRSSTPCSTGAPQTAIGAVVWNKAGRSLIRARQYVDCTGDGDLAAYAGAQFAHFAPGDPGAYSAGFTFRLCNVDLAAFERDLDARGILYQVAHAVKPGTDQPDLIRVGIDTPKLAEQTGEATPGYFLACSIRPRELTYCNCINYGPNDGLDAEALSAAETDLRDRMFKVVDLFAGTSKDAKPPPAGRRWPGSGGRAPFAATANDQRIAPALPVRRSDRLRLHRQRPLLRQRGGGLWDPLPGTAPEGLAERAHRRPNDDGGPGGAQQHP